MSIKISGRCERCSFNEATVICDDKKLCIDCYTDDLNYDEVTPKRRDEYYLNIAKAVSEESKCLKLKVGAVIVYNDAIVSTGYNGPPRGDPHCLTCTRKGVEHGKSYGEECPSVHAEENAIINAARNGNGINHSAIYIYSGLKYGPCYRCKRFIKNAGITRVVYK